MPSQIKQERNAYRENINVNQHLLRNGYYDAEAGLQDMVEALEFANDERLTRVVKLIKQAKEALNETELGGWI
jgi:hypothetical protein